MKISLHGSITVALLAMCLVACSGGDNADSGTTMAPEGQSAAATTQEVIPCPSDPGITYICGLMNAEDLLMVGDTGMILTSGMSNETTNGHMYLVNPLDDSWEELTTGPNYSADHDTAMFPNCPGPMDVSNFSSHGLALRETAPNTFDLYITSHGGREAIEAFELDLSEGLAELTWKGCVLLDSAIMHNSVAILNDGGFVTTQFMNWERGIGEVFAEPNGGVLVWHPGSEPVMIDGTMLTGPNGIAVSEDNRYIFVASFGSRELVRFDTVSTPVAKESVLLDIVLDNVRWASVPGKLLTAGGNAEGGGWSVVEVDADTLEAVTIGNFDGSIAMQGVSSALQVNDEIWIGTYNGDRIGYFTRQ
jgi:hypothetical protein